MKQLLSKQQWNILPVTITKWTRFIPKVPAIMSVI
jgi:hypothetical protein